MQNSQNQIRVSVSEAARLLGLSTKSIRDAIKNQEVRYIVARNRYKISFDSLIRWSQGSTRRSNTLAKDGIGQFVHAWKIGVPKYSPRPPEKH